MHTNQQIPELIPTENLPSTRSRAKKAFRIALLSLVGIIALAAVFFLLFVHSRPAPAQVLEDLKASSASPQPVAQQKAAIDALSQQSKPAVPPNDARALLQQLSQ